MVGDAHSTEIDHRLDITRGSGFIMEEVYPRTASTPSLTSGRAEGDSVCPRETTRVSA